MEQEVAQVQPCFPTCLADCSRGWVLWEQKGLHMSVGSFLERHYSASSDGQSCLRLFDRRHQGVATGHIRHMRHIHRSVVERRRARHSAVDRKLAGHIGVGRKRAVCRKHRRAERIQAGGRQAGRRQAGHSEAEHKRAERSVAERRQAGRSEGRRREMAERRRVGRRRATRRREMALRRQVQVEHVRV